MGKNTWKTPLEERIYKTPYTSPYSMMRAISVVTPEFVYYYLAQLLTYGMAYWIGTGQYNASTSDFFREHSLFCAALIRILAVTLAVVPLIYPFIKEYPIILPKKESAGRRICIICILAVVSSLLLNSLAILTGFAGSSSSFSKTSSAQFSLPVWAGIIVYGIVTPVTEEIVHRGLIYNRLRRYFGFEIALVGSSLLFGLFHGNTVQLVYGSLMGMMLAYIYERYGAFLYPVLFHCMANIAVYVCMSIDNIRDIVISVPAICVWSIMLLGGMYMLISEKPKTT